MTISNPRFAEIIQEVVSWARCQETAVARADAARTAQAELVGLLQMELAEAKAEAIRELWTTGWSLREIGQALGISTSRVEQIIKR